MKILKEEQIEKLLVANWTQFIDVSLLRTFVQQAVQKNLNKLSVISMKSPLKGNSISLSRFYFENNGYYFWVEFYNIIEKHIAEGTMEIFVPFENNQIKMISIIGSLCPVSNNI